MGETYPYEDLDGRRFQRLAQSLITAEHPRVQCFPISGPDGGRDATVLDVTDDNVLVDATIYQAKFRERNALGTPTADDLFNWVTRNLKSEAPKLRDLKTRGARELVFVCNVSASGHLSTGLRDRVQEWATEHLPLPASFWWREDLDARLDRHPALIFKFMLFRGVDSVRAYLAQTLSAEEPQTSRPVGYSPRHPAVTTILKYLSRQYEEESNLRFKQAHVDAPLIDSFVDVPILLKFGQEKRDLKFKCEALWEQLQKATRPQGRGDFFEPAIDGGQQDSLGAATVLLSDHDVTELDRLVIEAGPGQGKSTLIQFLGQVNRARLLSKERDLAPLPVWLTSGPLRLPIRIELRHLAKWLQGIYPWADLKADESKAVNPSLHSYIADHVSHVTGGMRFTGDDLVAIVNSTPTLLLLDGLDEVPDLALRSRVVEVVTDFVQDMESLGAKLQVIATGRPSSLSIAPTFSRKIFTYSQLGDLTEDLTDEFANAWIARRSLPAEDASELLEALASCLTQPHVAELARTPMQLAILLWLVHTRGWNLPEKRTALYDAYITTLLDREADKTPVVRKFREDLIEIHGYLGWILHARSQQESGLAGDIESEDLSLEVWKFLQRKEGPTDRVDELIQGISRIFVLVERIEGRFEFQVQPLREFFAARHLYKTAPYHTNAVEVTGSRPERLEALIRDPHWMNVARFFCGWYDVGELADLAQRIAELREDESYSYSLHSRLLVAYLLNDHVAAAAPKSMRRIASHLTDPLSLRQMLDAFVTGRYQTASPSQFIPESSGLPTLLDAAKRLYLEPVGDQVTYELARLIRQVPEHDRAEWWMDHYRLVSGEDADEWMRRGVIADCLNGVATDDLLPIFGPESSTLQWVRCAEAGRMDVAITDGRMRCFIDALGRGYSPLSQSSTRASKYLRHLTRHTLRTSLFDPRYVDRMEGEVPAVEMSLDPDVAVILSPITELMQRCSQLRNEEGVEQADLIGKTLGEPWAAWRLALSIAPWSSGSGNPHIADEGISLSRRASALWVYREDVSFWKDQICSSVRDGQRMALAAALMSWAPGKVISALPGELRMLCDVLKPWEFSVIRKFVGMMNMVDSRYSIEKRTRIREGELSGSFDELPGCLLSMLELRMWPNASWELLENLQHSMRCVTHESFIHGFLVSGALRRMTVRRTSSDVLEVIRSHFQGARNDTLHTRHISAQGYESLRSRMDLGTARMVLSCPLDFPIELLVAAEERLEYGSGNASTLYQISKDRGWFSQSY
ncbi:NACHT domain-containing protein [Streptomyces sp. NPDC090093]|uniref:NACHT domain-containing protein n=1 Tax=Streptomyces sp. NPDC090093 TaxID=3365945 RepID=UPI00382D60C4